MATQLFLKQQFNSAASAPTYQYASLVRSVLTFITAVTNTSAGGSNIQMTQTAAGTLVAWISPPFASAATIAGTVTFNLWAKMNLLAANTTVAVSLIQYTGGAEGTTFLTASFGTAIGTTITNANWTGSPSSTTFAVGDRLVIKCLITNATALVMAPGDNCTMDYAGKTAASDGDSWIQLTESILFQNEAEFIQGVTASASAGFPGVSALGNLIVAACLWSGGGSASLADGFNTYNPIGTPLVIAAGNSWQLFHADSVASNTLTVTITAAGATNILLAEYGGMAAAPFDANNKATGTSTSPDSGAAVTNFANELIFGYVGDNNGSNNPTAGTGFVGRELLSARLIEDQSVTSTGSYHATATLTSSTWGALVATFKWGTQPSAFLAGFDLVPGSTSTLVKNEIVSY